MLCKFLFFVLCVCVCVCVCVYDAAMFTLFCYVYTVFEHYKIIK